MLTTAIVLVILGIIALVLSYNTLGWILIALGIIALIVKLVKGNKGGDSVPPTPAK